MKGKFLKKYHFLLISNCLEEFEQKLSLYFLVYFGKLLPLNFSYLDWLVIKLRPIRKQIIPRGGLNSHYLETTSLKSFNARKTFVMLLQFLTYVQHLDFKIEYLYGVPYRQVNFKLQDFLKFQDPMVKSSNHYQVEKLKEFFDRLQKGAFLTSFSDTSFRSLADIPQVKLEKGKQNYWIAKVCITEELFDYRYPFILPSFFRKQTTKDQFEVQFKFIQVFSSVDITKEFFVKEFLDSYPSVISNQRIQNIKKYFIQVVKLLEECNFIEDNYKIISNDSLHDTNELTIYNISEGFVIYEKLSVS